MINWITINKNDRQLLFVKKSYVLLTSSLLARGQNILNQHERKR